MPDVTPTEGPPMNSRKIICTNCGADTGEIEGQANSNPQPCPHCGSMEKTILVKIEEEVQAKESLRGKVKDDNYRSKDKTRRDFFHGDDLHKESGKWYKKERIIDKDNDYYKEVVTDPETGEVIHECEEPLSVHRDHGYAKNKIGG